VTGRELIAAWLHHAAGRLRAYQLFEGVADALDDAAVGIHTGRMPPDREDDNGGNL
jgi:hypothetical protein